MQIGDIVINTINNDRAKIVGIMDDRNTVLLKYIDIKQVNILKLERLKGVEYNGCVNKNDLKPLRVKVFKDKKAMFLGLELSQRISLRGRDYKVVAFDTYANEVNKVIDLKSDLIGLRIWNEDEYKNTEEDYLLKPVDASKATVILDDGRDFKVNEWVSFEEIIFDGDNEVQEIKAFLVKDDYDYADEIEDDKNNELETTIDEEEINNEFEELVDICINRNEMLNRVKDELANLLEKRICLNEVGKFKQILNLLKEIKETIEDKKERICSNCIFEDEGCENVEHCMMKEIGFYFNIDEHIECFRSLLSTLGQDTDD